MFPEPRKELLGAAPRLCQRCGTGILNSFSDIKTHNGRWAFVCDDCVPKWSIARRNHYGLGIGQRWERDKGRWFKTAG
jgi:hypothetical protein